MKKRFTEERIIGFLREAEAGMPIAELWRKHAFSEASYYLWRSKFGGHGRWHEESPQLRALWGQIFESKLEKLERRSIGRSRLYSMRNSMVALQKNPVTLLTLHAS